MQKKSLKVFFRALDRHGRFIVQINNRVYEGEAPSRYIIHKIDFKLQHGAGGRVLKELKKYITKDVTSSYSTNPSTGYNETADEHDGYLDDEIVEIYDEITAIEAIKGDSSLWPGEHFRHDFDSEAKVLGLKDGSILIISTKGKKLWKNFKGYTKGVDY